MQRRSPNPPHQRPERGVGKQIGERPAGNIGRGSAAIKAKRAKRKSARTGSSTYRRNVR